MSTQAEAHDERRTYAVVGSIGKATTCYLLEHILAALGRSTALVSTVETKVGSERAPVERDQVPDLANVLDRADERTIDDTIVELRWPQLREGGVLGDRPVSVAASTLFDEGVDGGASEHLDLAEAVLSSAQQAVILVDDEGGAELARRVPGAITVGTRPKGPDADWQVSINATRPDHIDFTITHRTGKSVSTSLWLPARFTVGLAALALVIVQHTGATGATLTRMLPRGLRPVVPGRMERVADHPRCIVDIAHNPARLTRSLSALRATTKGKIVAVVGARGTDDEATRRAIGRAAAAADSVVVTDDDHGSDDDAAAIRAEVMAGVGEGGAVVAEVSPRAAAIRAAVALAGRGDTVLVAGRGHLNVLRTGGATEHLDDREEVRAGLAQRDGSHADAG